VTPPPVTSILETGVYVASVPEAVAFYRRVFGFPVLVSGDRLAALAVADRQVLLLFLRGGSCEPLSLPGGILPPHDGSGTTHFCFAIAPDTLAAWRARLAECEVPVESEMHWERGGTSLYFRDPDGHLVELATPGVWAIY
jgi:catechol 2,3-dioxygenase-like lactoylglutathione lyase family enzyme